MPYHDLKRSAHQAQAALNEISSRLQKASDEPFIEDPQDYLLAVASHVLGEQITVAPETIDAGDPACRHELVSELLPFNRAVDSKRRTNLLLTILSCRPARQEAALLLYCGHKLSFEQIAERLGVSKGDVQEHVKQAIEHCLLHMQRPR